MTLKSIIKAQQKTIKTILQSSLMCIILCNVFVLARSRL